MCQHEPFTCEGVAPLPEDADRPLAAEVVAAALAVAHADAEAKARALCAEGGPTCRPFRARTLRIEETADLEAPVLVVVDEFSCGEPD